MGWSGVFGQSQRGRVSTRPSSGKATSTTTVPHSASRSFTCHPQGRIRDRQSRGAEMVRNRGTYVLHCTSSIVCVDDDWCCLTLTSGGIDFCWNGIISIHHARCPIKKCSLTSTPPISKVSGRSGYLRLSERQGTMPLTTRPS